jgi:hypothetical protein
LYSSLDVIRVIESKRMKCMSRVAHMRELRDAYKILARKHKGKRPLCRPRHKYNNNIGYERN